MKMLSVLFFFLSMRRFRVDRKEDEIVKHKVIKRVAAYKYIPRHAYHFLFEHGIFCEQLVELQRNVLFCISF